MESINDLDVITTRDAARRLGVSESRVRNMIAAGQLRTIRTDGRSRLIVADSVKKAKTLRGRSGRPYSPGMAMGALFMLSRITPGWLTSQQRYRLKTSLLDCDGLQLVGKVRSRAVIKEYWVGESAMTELREHMRISGAHDGVRAVFRLPAVDMLEGYVTEEELPKLEREFRLFETISSTSNLRLHIADILPDGEGAMPLAVCATDLAESADTREMREGVNALNDMLRSFKERKGV